MSPVGNLERGDRDSIEVDSLTQTRVSTQLQLASFIQAGREVGKPVVHEREHIGDLDPFVEEKQMKAAQVRRDIRVADTLGGFPLHPQLSAGGHMSLR
ncbi:hypothetical protein BAU01nite_04720 [Brevibacterium aurantiacum]|nr:hypothetical protein BAU01nite_04720 [Brevibacterium aurantiacum]